MPYGRRPHDGRRRTIVVVTSRFGRRLLSLATVQIAVVFCALILALALFAFSRYVQGLNAEATSTLGQLQAALHGGSATGDAEIASDVVARYARSDLVVILLDARHRVTVFRAPAGGSAAKIVTATHGAPPSEPQPRGPFVAPVVGFATAFGLHVEHADIGRVTVIVRHNEVTLVSTTASFLWPVLLALGCAIVAAFLLARVIVRQLIEPLVEVQRALNRFASGDLTPQPIAADMRAELAPLAIAYNGAIAQMERAFAERDSANAAIRQFMADAGHQLRTPLTVIRGFIAVLRKGDLRSPEDRERILATMNRQSLVMGSLIDKLMLLDRWERDDSMLHSEPIDVAQLVADVASPLAEAQPGRRLRVETETDVLAAIDPSDLAHAITNLVDNALKYTPGEVRVGVHSEDFAVVVTIADDGPGMTAAEVAHVFDRFYRGNRRDVDGSGLGLAIAKRAVERAGGTLTVETGPGTGSTFTIRLPRTTHSSASAPVPSPA